MRWFGSEKFVFAGSCPSLVLCRVSKLLVVLATRQVACLVFLGHFEWTKD